MLGDVVQAGAHVLDVVEEQASLVRNPEHDVENAFLGLGQSEDTGEELRSHLGDGAAHRMSLLAEYVVETYRAALELRILDSEFRHSLLYEAAGPSGLGYSGKVSLHVGHEARDAGLAEALGHHLQGDGLSGSCGSGYKSVPVGHLPYDGERPFFAVGYPEPVIGVVHISLIISCFRFMLLPVVFPDCEEYAGDDESTDPDPRGSCRIDPEADLVHQDESDADRSHEAGRQ